MSGNQHSSQDIPTYLAEFLDFERGLALSELTIKGVQFWDFIRQSVFYQAIYQSHQFSFRQSSLAKRLLRYALEFLAGLVYVTLDAVIPTRGKPYDILIVNYDRKNRIGEVTANINFYPVIRHLKDRYRILLIDPGPLGDGAARTYGCDVIKSRRYHVWDRIRMQFTRFTPAERQILTDLKASFEKRFGQSINIEKIARDVFAFELIRRRRYARLLKRHRPSVVCYADDGNQKGLITAAHRFDIPCVDFQHAQINPYNVLYNYPPQADTSRPASWSDYVFTFGEYWHSMYQMPIKLRAVGFPYFEIKKAEAVSHPGPHYENKSRNIIIISDQFSRSMYCEAALGLCRRLPDHRVFFKLRQDDFENWRDRYPAEFSTTPNLVVVDNNDVSLYSYFAACSYAVGVNSTALYEGLAFDLVTFILREEAWYREMAPLLDGGHAFLVDNSKDIVDRIVAEDRPPHPLNLETIFRGDATRRIESELQAIISENRSA